MNQLFRWDQTGLFLLALAAGILPFAVPEICAAALREGLTLCSGPLLLSLFPFLVVSRLLIQCPESDLLALPFRLAAWGIGIRTPGCSASGSWVALHQRPVLRRRQSGPVSLRLRKRMPCYLPVSVPGHPLWF